MIPDKRFQSLNVLAFEIYNFLRSFKFEEKSLIIDPQNKIRLYFYDNQILVLEGDKDIGFLDYIDRFDKKGYKLWLFLNKFKFDKKIYSLLNKIISFNRERDRKHRKHRDNIVVPITNSINLIVGTENCKFVQDNKEISFFEYVLNNDIQLNILLKSLNFFIKHKLSIIKEEDLLREL
ncbi:MAG: hypothetical protein H7836_04575 [Magnetococcus sp. YQC-3]